MSSYIIGDIHGCEKTLKALLAQVDFNPSKDTLWSVGDLIGRGPRALNTVKYLMSLDNDFRAVLGNHDLHFLAVANKLMPQKDKDCTSELLNSPQCNRIQDWLRATPLLQDSSEGFMLVHAGIHPSWTLHDAQSLANEVSERLQSKKMPDLLKSMYGDEPENWALSLSKTDRYRFIINVLTRMRYLRSDRSLELNWKESLEKAAPEPLQPWYTFWPKMDKKVFFGHWAALNGKTERDDIIGLDTGCVWGKSLTLYDWTRQEKISQNCCDY